MKRNGLYVYVLIAGFALVTTSARADEQLISAFGLPASVNLVVNETGCDNSGGPEVTLEGTIVLGGVNAKLTFSNNQKGTHTTNVVSEYELTLFLGGSITIPKQPVQGGVGGNPHIYLQFHDGAGSDLGQEFYLGRCVQGLEVSTDLVNAALLLANIETDGCSNRKGPFVTMSGELTLSGVHARIIFRNNKKGTHTAEQSVHDVALVLQGSSIKLPKQPSKGGVGGNPLITIQFLQENGDPIGDAVLLGRCNQI